MQEFRKAKKDVAQMTDIATAQELMQGTFPASRYGNIKAAIWAAYRRLKLPTERRAESIWYGTARRIDASEMDALRKEKAKQDAIEQENQLRQAAEYLRSLDEGRYRQEINTLERVISETSL